MGEIKYPSNCMWNKCVKCISVCFPMKKKEKYLSCVGIFEIGEVFMSGEFGWNEWGSAWVFCILRAKQGCEIYQIHRIFAEILNWHKVETWKFKVVGTQK